VFLQFKVIVVIHQNEHKTGFATQPLNKFNQGPVTEGEGLVQLTHLALTSLDRLLLILEILFSVLQNKLP
jgi:hypothetical protein